MCLHRARTCFKLQIKNKVCFKSFKVKVKSRYEESDTRPNLLLLLQDSRGLDLATGQEFKVLTSLSKLNQSLLHLGCR